MTRIQILPWQPPPLPPPPPPPPPPQEQPPQEPLPLPAPEDRPYNQVCDASKQYVLDGDSTGVDTHMF
eukprot:SAG22_NODE_2256_length_2780_cov_20.080194_2_plen_68_part_00